MEMSDAASAATRAGLDAGRRRGLVRRRLLRRPHPVARLESEPLAGLPLHRAARTLAGAAIGIVRELLGYTASPVEVLSRAGLLPRDRRQLLRVGAAILGTILLANGATRLPRGEGRGAAAAIVLAGV